MGGRYHDDYCSDRNMGGRYHDDFMPPYPPGGMPPHLGGMGPPGGMASPGGMSPPPSFSSHLQQTMPPPSRGMPAPPQTIGGTFRPGGGSVSAPLVTSAAQIRSPPAPPPAAAYSSPMFGSGSVSAPVYTSSP